MPTWTPSGGIEVGGCPTIYHDRIITLQFAVGDIAYVRSSAAERGLLEKVAIKKIRKTNLPEEIVNYVDTYNAIHTDDQLVDHEDALDLAIAYWQDQMDLIYGLDACEDISDIDISIAQARLKKFQNTTPVPPAGDTTEVILQVGKVGKR